MSLVGKHPISGGITGRIIGAPNTTHIISPDMGAVTEAADTEVDMGVVVMVQGVRVPIRAQCAECQLTRRIQCWDKSTWRTTPALKRLPGLVSTARSVEKLF